MQNLYVFIPHHLLHLKEKNYKNTVVGSRRDIMVNVNAQVSTHMDPPYGKYSVSFDIVSGKKIMGALVILVEYVVAWAFCSLTFHPIW